MIDPLIQHPEMRSLVERIRSDLARSLHGKLVGLYSVGSLVVGDFDPLISDVDFVAVTTAPLDNLTGESLRQMHAKIARDFPSWDNRIEVVYVAVDHLRHPDQLDRLAVISPGEPFHIFAVNADDWLLNWYLLRLNGVTLLGADPQTLVEPITLDELLPRLRDQLRGLVAWSGENLHLGAQAYVILTFCRALCLFETGDFVSKLQAARWTAAEFPAWSPLIERALAWRQRQNGAPQDDDSALSETRRFAQFALERLDSIGEKDE